MTNLTICLNNELNNTLAIIKYAQRLERANITLDIIIFILIIILIVLIIKIVKKVKNG